MMGRRGAGPRPSSDRHEGRELTPMAGPVTIAVLGAGARGTVFASFAEQFPQRARVVAVADPRADRRDALGGRLGVPAGQRFADWRDVGAGGGPPSPAWTAASSPPARSRPRGSTSAS